MTRKAKSQRSTRNVSRAAKGNGESPQRRWSQRVMNESDAIDLPAGIFKLQSARAIAKSLKKSSESSHRRKSSPFRSAMSMLNFEINRSGKNLSAERLGVLNRAKSELRKVFGRSP